MATKREVLAEFALGRGVLAKAADDEPIFILRAGDHLALQALGAWLGVAGENGVGEEKLEGARAILEEFKAWPLEKRKMPD